MFALAHQIFTELEKDGEVKQDVGWFACTTEEVPDIQFDAELPNQIVMHKSQLVNRSLDFLPLGLCNIHSISSQTSQPGIICIKCKE